MAAIQLDIGLLITAIAALLAFGRGWGDLGRVGWMRQTLVVAWLSGGLAILTEQPMPTVVFLTAMMDFTIAGVAVAILMNDPTRSDARIVGTISLALMPAHFVVSANHGLPSFPWALYAATCNGAFVVQCLITGGWLDGLGRSISSLIGWIRRVPLLRFRGR
jgi:hypothetical protein